MRAMAWISRINRLSDPEKEGLYRNLIPPPVFRICRINPLTFTDAQGSRLVRFFCRYGEDTTLVEVKREPGDRDCVYSMQVSDTTDLTQLNFDFVVVNDPDSERFDTDVDPEGRDTLFGMASRNLREEERALHSGLAPGQVRKGLGLTGDTLNCLEFFCRILDIKSITLEALYYHNAILYEKHGFAYFRGFRQMESIHKAFQEGGELFRKLDGSSPFRKPGFEKSIRLRSWAVHDGILDDLEDEKLGDGWISPRMYQMVGHPSQTCTFPDALY